MNSQDDLINSIRTEANEQRPTDPPQAPTPARDVNGPDHRPREFRAPTFDGVTEGDPSGRSEVGPSDDESGRVRSDLVFTATTDPAVVPHLSALLSAVCVALHGEDHRRWVDLPAEVSTLREALAAVTRDRNILSLAIPLEEQLNDKITETLKYLAMEQGFTLNGLARLFVECQRRMADDWVQIGRERRERQQAEQRALQAEGTVRTLQDALDTDFGTHPPVPSGGSLVERVQVLRRDAIQACIDIAAKYQIPGHTVVTGQINAILIDMMALLRDPPPAPTTREETT